MNPKTERIEGQDVYVIPALIESPDGQMTPTTAHLTVRDGQLIDWSSRIGYVEDGHRTVRGWDSMEEDCVALSWGAVDRLIVQRSDVRWMLAPDPA